MHWQYKAAIMRTCASLPFGHHLYTSLQKRFGRLKIRPLSRLPHQAMMMRWLLEQQHAVVGKTFFEVGTGHIPIVPIGFFLAGAAQVITVDLHRRIEWGLTGESLAWIHANKHEVRPLYGHAVTDDLFEERFALLTRWRAQPKKFLEAANIHYLAPADAARTQFLDQSIDCHFSVNVLEHIAPDTLVAIFKEAQRILRPSGYALHFFDPSDHFQHQDKRISRINFLKYPEREWQRIAGNEYAYCNRLRSSDYQQMFANLGFQVVRWETTVDTQALELLQQGFRVDPQFQAYTPEDLCTTGVRVMLKDTTVAQQDSGQ